MMLDMTAGGPGSGRHKMGIEDAIKDKISDLKGKDRKFGDSVLANDTVKTPGVFSKEDKEFLDNINKRSGTKYMGECYKNAQEFCKVFPNAKGLKYMEGYAHFPGSHYDDPTVEHAWVEYNGKVYDPTMQTTDGKWQQKYNMSNQPNARYMGHEVDPKLGNKLKDYRNISKYNMK